MSAPSAVTIICTASVPAFACFLTSFSDFAGDAVFVALIFAATLAVVGGLPALISAWTSSFTSAGVDGADKV